MVSAGLAIITAAGRSIVATSACTCQSATDSIGHHLRIFASPWRRLMKTPQEEARPGQAFFHNYDSGKHRNWFID